MDTHSKETPVLMNPLVSVIMPAYNARPYIEQAIRSVLDQDYPQLELIVVDDGSNDGTPELAEQFGNRVKVLRQKNAGPAAARNRGFAASQGEFIAFLDADDVWLAGKASMQVRYLQNHSETGLVYGDFKHWRPQADGTFLAPPSLIVERSPFAVLPEHSGWIYTALLFDNVVHIITAMLRRSVIEAVGGLDENLSTGEDYDFWLRISRQFRADKLDCTIAYYREHAAGITKTPRKENNEYAVLVKTLDAFGLSGPDGIAASSTRVRDRLFRLCFSHGYFHIRSGDPQVAQQAFTSALRYAPLRPKVWAYWIAAFVKHRLVHL